MAASSLVTKLEESKKTRIKVFITVLLVVLFLIALSVFFIQALFLKEQKEIESHIKEVAKQSAVATEILINGDFQTLSVYAHILEQEPKYLDKANVRAGLQTAIKNTRFYSMGVAYPDGSIIIYDAKKGLAPDVNVKTLTYFQEGMKGNKTVNFFNSFYDDDKLIVLYAVPVIKNGKPIAILTGANDAKDYTRASEITSFNAQAVVHIIDAEGDIILRDKSPNAMLNSSIFENKDVSNDLRNEALKSDKPFSYWFKDKNGVKKVAAYIPIGYNNWKVLAILPLSSISHNSNAVLRYAVILFLIINIIVILGIRYNIIMRQRSNNMIMDMALQDDVTKSLNKTSFYLEAEKMLLNRPQLNEHLAVIMMDIDGFKIVNEVYNVNMGDKILKDIANIISKHLEEDGIFARLNDDVFAIMYKYQLKDDLVSFVSKIINDIEQFDLNIKIVPSIGIYEVTDFTLQVNKMCDKANIAKRTIKGIVGDRYVFFNETLSQAILADKEIEDEMRQALEEKQFVMYLQPKIGMKTMRPCGSEALIRWQHPVKGLIPPYKFIPLFEKNGFVVEVDKYMWEQACIAIRSWIDAGREPLPISVNLSRMHFKYANLVDIIEDLVQKYDIPKKYLELELTESAFLDNEGAVNSTIVKLQNSGFTIAMDDFGVGYSSLNMLRTLPVNVLKLDRGFINEATCSKRGFIVLNHVINMAKDLNATVVCEGIETKEQAETLRTAGCDIAQGFLYAKPMPLADYNEYVYNHEGSYEV